jgi:hypothetical protein
LKTPKEVGGGGSKLSCLRAFQNHRMRSANVQHPFKTMTVQLSPSDCC